MLIKHSNTSNILRVALKNSSTGVGLTGLTNASAGLIIATICNNEATATVYTQAASNIETIAALGTYAAPTASKCRFKEVDATNHKGLYEFHFADARFAIENARSLVISVTGAASLLDVDYEIQLVSFDPHDSIDNQVWNAILTGATYNTPNSAGRRVREVGAFAIHSGTAQTGTSCSITLSALANANDGVYNRNLIVIVGGTGIGQTRTIVDYDAGTNIVVVDRDWRVSPDNTSEYQIVPDDTPLTVDHGKVREATANTIKIREYASSVDDGYLCNIIAIITGTGRGQARLVGAYDGTSKVVTLCGDDWTTIPDITSVYAMIPYGASCTSCMNDNALAQVNAEIADVLKTDTKGEPAQGAPGATLSIEDKIAYIYKFLRNKIWTTATEIKIYNDAGNVVDHKTTISDNGTTFKRDEFESGP